MEVMERIPLPTRQMRQRLRDLPGEGHRTAVTPVFPSLANSLDSGVNSRLYSRHESKNGEPRSQNRSGRPGDGHQHRYDPFLREAGIVEAIAAYRRRIPLIRTERYRNPKICPQGSGTGVFAE